MQRPTPQPPHHHRPYRPPRLRRLALAFAACCACDGPCDAEPAAPPNQDPGSLSACPPLPGGVDPISGLEIARAYPRFDGLMITLSDRPLTCGEAAAQHDYCGEGRGLTLGLPAGAGLGLHPLRHPLYLEYETPTARNVGGGGQLAASVELFSINDACVTGRIIGLEQAGGPFEGGFQAPRCAP